MHMRHMRDLPRIGLPRRFAPGLCAAFGAGLPVAMPKRQPRQVTISISEARDLAAPADAKGNLDQAARRPERVAGRARPRADSGRGGTTRTRRRVPLA